MIESVSAPARFARGMRAATVALALGLSLALYYRARQARLQV